MKLALLVLPFLFISCSNYVSKWHNQIDREMALSNNKYKLGPKNNDNVNLYRRNLPASKRFSQQKAISQSKDKMHSTQFTRNLNPNVKRQYTPENRVRVRANDLTDNGNEGSLWVGAGQENYLFSRNNSKKSGDIVVIEVQNKLKTDITLELSRAFPEMKKKKKDGTPEAAAEKPEEEKEAANDTGGTKIYDRISSVVIEEINSDHLLLRGRKDVLFKKKKRLVEVQALIARRDVTDSDSVPSSRIIETSVAVLR